MVLGAILKLSTFVPSDVHSLRGAKLQHHHAGPQHDGSGVSVPGLLRVAVFQQGMSTGLEGLLPLAAAALQSGPAARKAADRRSLALFVHPHRAVRPQVAKRRVSTPDYFTPQVCVRWPVTWYGHCAAGSVDPHVGRGEGPLVFLAHGHAQISGVRLRHHAKLRHFCNRERSVPSPPL